MLECFWVVLVVSKFDFTKNSQTPTQSIDQRSLTTTFIALTKQFEPIYSLFNLVHGCEFLKELAHVG